MRSRWWDLMMLDGSSFPIHRSPSLLSRRAPWASDPPNCCWQGSRKKKELQQKSFRQSLWSEVRPRHRGKGPVSGFGFRVPRILIVRLARNSELGARNPELNSWPRWEVFDRVTV